MPGDSKWQRRNFGPVVRPYAVTGGRTAPAAGETLDLIDIVAATGSGARVINPMHDTPEHRRIRRMCDRQITVADLASETDLPLGVVRVLLADLIDLGVVEAVRPQSVGSHPSSKVLQEILNGLRAL